MKTESTEVEVLRQELVDLIQKGNAHVSFEQATRNLSMQTIGSTPFGLPYSIWKIVEHIRTIQADILDFSRNPEYKSPKWPDDFWPIEDAPAGREIWEKSISAFKSDRDAFIALIQNPENDLFKPFPYGDGQNLLREAMLIADHTSYHTGEIIVLRRLQNDWEG